MKPWSPVAPHRSQLGESPVWHPTEGMLYWIDIRARQLLRCNVFMGEVDAWELPAEPGCIAPARSGGWVIALRDGVYRAREWRGELRLLARFNHDARVQRFNDGKCDPLGRFWAGTLYEPKGARKGDLYCVDCRPDNGNPGKAQVSLKAHNVVTANGLAFSPQADRVYWADTQHHVIWTWDWDARANVLKHHRVFHQFADKPAGWAWGDPRPYGGRPDGAAVDAEGCYWVAMYEGGRVLRFSPEGAILAELTVPASRPTMPCFGGDDLRTLYVTTASHGVSDAERAAFPAAGQVLSLRVDVPGVPAHLFVD